MRHSLFRRLLIALGVAFLAVLALVLWLGGPRSEVRLADGTRLRLLGVTAGTTNVTFEIIVQRLRTMEFYLEPPRESV